MGVTFRGGTHPKGCKSLSCNEPLRRFETKGEIVLPLVHGIGRPAKPVVKKGDPVLVGQIIAEAEGFVSANVACSCSGTVKAVEKRRTISGALLECVVVDNDGLYTKAEGIGVKQDISSISGEEIIERVKHAGIIGLGGAGFPTHIKLAPKDPSAIKYVIVNGAECEPYITCNDQLMQSESEGILRGLEIILKLFPNAEGVVVIEDNKPKAIEAMRKALSARGSEGRMRIQPAVTKYPQGGERSLIQAIAGMDYPVAKLPADAGCVVQNVGTVYAIWRAVEYNETLYSHVLTVTGDAVSKPANFFVPDGTLVSELIEACGGIKEGVELKKAISGGPMMGFAMSSIDVPVVKTTNAITLLPEDPVEKAEAQMTNCLHCGRCSTVCPQGLVPQLMADAIATGDLERYEKKLYGLECISCGSCTFVCPAKRPLTQMFKMKKTEILAAKRAQAGGGK
ncbi:MAG: electron transport complex subunit RsxC [Sphaerochaetaceae bacterium]|nr:electron transport complex subunit RsxC [Sphaerochaetaceae bacterium]